MRSFRVQGLTDDELRRAAAAAGLALRVDELRRIAERLGRDPSMVEVHAFDAQWSEHCSYKSSRHLLRKLPTEGPTVMQGPAEDAGILHLGEWQGEKWGVVIAHESHNHPSQVVPFEGAATGVGGIVRDVLCMGAEVIAIADPLRFGRAEDPDSHQRYVARGVVDGISAYGNAIGVPNIAGDVYFDERFDDNCLVNVVALGLIKERDIIHSAAPPGSAGWDIVLVGKATDTSGFGGAAFSSVTLDEEDEDANKGAVQVPDPFLKNVIMRATYRVFSYLRERNITAGFKDLGAGGIMGCTAELCASGGFGAIVDLDDVNTAIKNMPPEVIAVGETQERLCWILPGDVTADILQIYNQEFSLPEIARSACATVIGCVQGDKQYVLRHGDEIVMDVPIEFLTGSIRDDLPVRPMSERKVTDPARRYVGGSYDLAELFPRILGHRDVCSREPLYVRYDGVVRGTTVVPRGNASAGVIAPLAGSPFGVALAVAGNPRYSKADPFLAAEYAVLESVRKVTSVGARALGLTDCLNFGNPQNVDHYSELVYAIDGLAMAASRLGTPYVSGNVSLYNESRGGNAIPASPIVACVGALDDVARTITPALKRAGSALYAVGTPQNASGGAVFAELLEQTGGPLAPIDYDRANAEIAFLHAARDAGLILSSRSIGNGGVAVALAEMAFSSLHASPVGVRLSQPESWTDGTVGDLESYFGECWGFVVETGDRRAFEAIASEEVRVFRIGETIANATFALGGVQFNLRMLRAAWSSPLAELYP
ncbi:MAG TPA: phosphoribosylformylglycinamidine synthase subunit PurL [Candidatus Baltobacteraceae bacterium]|nr:phosphoribosylformylglycinamidine synthase subunit PurL [Candidatus Baltobacteraceae bacterium]